MCQFWQHHRSVISFYVYSCNMAAPSFDIYFQFKGKERKALVKKYNDGSYSVGFSGDEELTKEFTANIFFYPNGTSDYHKNISASDKAEFEKAVFDAIKRN